MGREELRTSRLTLRRPIAADIDAILRIHRDPRACAHNPGDALADRAEAEERFGAWDQHWEQHGFGYWCVRRVEAPGSEPIGFSGIKWMELHGRPVLNLFYRFDPAAWGEAIGTEAASAVVGWATTQLPGRPLIARVRPDNAASLKVAERLGLRRRPELDTSGENGVDWIFTTNWPVGSSP